MDAPPAIPAIAPDEATQRLEAFLESGLRQHHERVLRRRDAAYKAASDSHKLARLLRDDLRRVGRPVLPDDVADATAAVAAGGASRATSASSSVPAEGPMRMLVDLGQRVYGTVEVDDPSVVFVNIGCDILCPLTVSEALDFLRRKEAAAKAAADALTKEALRLRFRMRLVMEAIGRLQAPPGAR